MIDDKLDSAKGISMDYHFDEKQIKLLAKFFRKYQKNIPSELIDFSMKLEKSVYNIMSIAEAEVFFS